MTASKRSILFIVLAASAMFQVSASYRLVLQSGHEGAPIDVQWHKQSGMLLSVGEDGRFIVTNPGSKKVIHRFRVTDDRIHRFQSDPSGSRAALLTSREGAYTVSVWDWGSEEKKYEFPLESEPLFMSWSAQGQYLIVGKIEDPSILILYGKTGKRLSYLERLPSLYSSGYIGKTEKILMTYTSSGDLRYWDIRTSTQKLFAETLPNLRDLTVLQFGNKTNLFARRGETLYIINRQTGTVLDQLELPGLLDAAIDAFDGTLDVLIASTGGARIRQYTILDGMFTDRDFTISEIPLNTLSAPIIITRGNNHTYVATASGELLMASKTELSLISEDRLWRPQALAFDDGRLYMSNGSQVLRITSPFFSEDSSSTLEDLKTHTSRLLEIGGAPGGETGLDILPDGRVITWDRDSGVLERGIRTFDFTMPDTMRFIKSTSAIKKLKVIDLTRALTVDQSGTIRILDSQSGTVLTEYMALGILDAAYSPEGDFILVGRSANNRARTSLESIDVDTRESSPIPDDRFMVYNVVAGEHSIYTMGITQDSKNGKTTTLLAHDIKNPSQTQVLRKLPGEDLNAMMLPHSSDKGVYTTFGGEMRKILGSREITYSWDEPILNLREHGTILYGIDRGGSLVLWRMKDGSQALLEVHFFKGGSWLALQPNSDSIWSSSEALKNFILYRKGKEIEPKEFKALQIVMP